MYKQCSLSRRDPGTSVQSLSCVQLFSTPWTAACQASLSITNSKRLLKLMSIELAKLSNHLILCHQSFPALGSFPVSQFFPSGGQSIGASASASVLPMNIQDWFPLGWTAWISLQSKGLARVFSSTIVQKHQFFGTQLGELKKISWNYFDQTDVYSGSDGKESSCNELDPRLIPELWRFPGAGHGNPYQYSCLENSMNREAWRVTVHGLIELDMTERLALSLHFTSLNNYRIDFSLGEGNGTPL